MMRIQEAMTRQVHIANPNQSIGDAACMMAVADAEGPDTPVRDVMSPEVCYCFEDQEIDEVADAPKARVSRRPYMGWMGWCTAGCAGKAPGRQVRDGSLSGAARDTPSDSLLPCGRPRSASQTAAVLSRGRGQEFAGEL